MDSAFVVWSQKSRNGLKEMAKSPAGLEQERTRVLWEKKPPKELPLPKPAPPSPRPRPHPWYSSYFWMYSPPLPPISPPSWPG